MAKRVPGEPDRQMTPDRDVGGMFLIGCVALFVLFLLLAVSVWWFWMH